MKQPTHVTVIAAVALAAGLPAQVTISPIARCPISAGSLQSSPPPPGPAPLWTKAQATLPTTVDLSWQPVQGAAGYRVMRKPPASTSWQQLTPAGFTGTSFADRAIRPSTTMQYQLWADFPPCTTPSGGSTVQTVTTPIGAVPLFFAAQMPALGLVRLTWQTPAGASSVVLKEQRWPGGLVLAPTFNAFTDSIPAEGIYTYQIYARYFVQGEGEIEGDLSNVPTVTANASAVCPALGSTGGGGIPGTLVSNDSLAANPPTGSGKVTIGIFPGGRSGDGIRLEIEDGSWLGLRANEVVVRLVKAVNWDKEIAAWNSCTGGALTTIKATQKNAAPVEMRVHRYLGGTNTLVFRKPAFGGVWVDVFHLDPGQFWTIFGGKIATFTWIVD